MIDKKACLGSSGQMDELTFDRHSSHTLSRILRTIYPPIYVTILISCKERPGAEISDWADGDTGSFDAEMGSVAKMFSAQHAVL